MSRQTCKRFKECYDPYVSSGAYEHDNGAFRARRMEGAGCAIFGAGMVDVGGLLRCLPFWPAWARTEMIGSARIADCVDAGKYEYDGTMVARQ